MKLFKIYSVLQFHRVRYCVTVHLMLMELKLESEQRFQLFVDFMFPDSYSYEISSFWLEKVEVTYIL
jgi:hypothetical protein